MPGSRLSRNLHFSPRGDGMPSNGDIMLFAWMLLQGNDADTVGTKKVWVSWL